MPVNMHLADPDQAAILGVKPSVPAITNQFVQALELSKQGKIKEAEKIYVELLNANFNNPALLAALGMGFATQEMNGLALLVLEQSLAGVNNIIPAFEKLGVFPKGTDVERQAFIDNKKSEILNAIGTCYKHENMVDEARSKFIAAQELIPLNADIQNNLGTLYINEGSPSKALEHLDLALTIQPGHPQARWNKSLAHLELGDYENGWKHYDAGLDAGVRIQRNYSKNKLPLWKGEKGKRIVVHGEQGIGDEIMFASCLNELIQDSELVVFDCHKKLHQLFCNSFPNIDIYPTREDEMVTWPINSQGEERYHFDAVIPIGSLPKFYRPDLDSFSGFPYIKPSVEKEAKCNVLLSKLPDRPNIGIGWMGGHKRTRLEVRSTPLDSLLPILQQDANFISLQYTDCQREVMEFQYKHNIPIYHWPELVASDNYDDTAALIANLDLVITVCSSAVHLCGAMGVPCWVLTPSRPAWRYRLDLDYMPWYGNNNTLFRQAPGSTDWRPVIEEVASSLAELLSGVNHGKT